MGAGGSDGKEVLAAFKRIHNDEPESGDFSYFYQYMFEKMIMPEYWAERSGLKPKYETLAVVHAAKMNNHELLEFLLKRAALSAEAVDSNNRSALSWSVMHNSYPMVELILNSLSSNREAEGAKLCKRMIELQEKDSGRCPLHWLMNPTMVGTFAN